MHHSLPHLDDVEICSDQIKLCSVYNREKVGCKIDGAFPCLETALVHARVKISARQGGIRDAGQFGGLANVPHQLNANVKELPTRKGDMTIPEAVWCKLR